MHLLKIKCEYSVSEMVIPVWCLHPAKSLHPSTNSWAADKEKI